MERSTLRSLTTLPAVFPRAETPIWELPVEASLTPSRVTELNWGARPRMTILFASPELSRVETPGRRLMAAAALKSGSSWILASETTLEILDSASCWLIACTCPCAWAVMMYSLPFSASALSAILWRTRPSSLTVTGMLDEA